MPHLLKHAIAVSLLCAVAASRADLKQPVTVSGGFRMADLAARLSEQTGTELTVARELENEPVMVRLKGVTGEDAIARIATAVNGEWTANGQGFRIGRSQNFRARLKRDRDEREQRAVRKWLDDQLAKLSAPADRNDRDEGIRIAGGGIIVRGDRLKGPGGRAVLQILSQLGPAALTGFEDGQRVVYSSFPTRMESALPNVSSLIDQAVAEAMEARQNSKNDPDPTNRTLSISNGVVQTDSAMGDPAARPYRTLLVVQQQPFGGISANLAVYDAKGKALVNNGTYVAITEEPSPDFESPEKISVDPTAKAYADLLSPNMPEAPRFTGGVSIAIMMNSSDEGDDSDTFRFGNDRGINRQKAPSAWQEIAQHPERFEPWSQGPGLALIRAAESANVQMVADIPDDRYVPDASFVSHSSVTTLHDLVAGLTAHCRVAREQDWLVIQPADPLDATATRVPRGALAKLIDRVKTTSLARLDDIANYAVARGKPLQMMDLDVAYIGMTNSGEATRIQNALGAMDFEMIRLYGMLSPVQRGQARKGQSMPLEGLTADQFACLQRLTFWGMIGPQVDHPGPGFDYEGLAAERTVLLPIGLTRSGFYTMTVKETPAVYAETESGGSVLTAADLASSMFLAENTKLRDKLGAPPSYSNYRPMTSERIQVHVQLSPEASLSRELRDAWFVTGSRPGNYDQLPSSFRDLVAKSLEKARKSLTSVEFVLPGQQGTGQP